MALDLHKAFSPKGLSKAVLSQGKQEHILKGLSLEHWSEEKASDL